MTIGQSTTNERESIIRFHVAGIAYLRSYFEDGERFQETTITYRCRSLHDARPLRAYLAIQVRPFVKIRPGEIELAKVSRVVHVGEQWIHVRRGADTCERKININFHGREKIMKLNKR